METINLTITKQDFESAVPAAREPKGTVFSKIEPHINRTLSIFDTIYLGDKGVDAVNSDTESYLSSIVKKAACLRAFIDNMRSLDLVLTGTGFGVVSTNDTAPASKLRVDSLLGELQVQWLRIRSEMLQLLFAVEGWSEQGVRLCCVQSLFWNFNFLNQFASFESPVSKDWEDAQSVIMSEDAILRQKISDAFMDELISQECSLSVTDANAPVIFMIRQYFGMAIKGDRQAAYNYYCRLMNYIEKNIDNFATYANSEAYNTNHIEPYENKKEDSAFHFVG